MRSSRFEAFAEQHRRLLLELRDEHLMTLPEKKVTRLREIREVLQADGAIEQRDQHLQILDKIKEVYTAARDGFGQELAITFGDAGWASFKEALDLRHRLTHPKKQSDCWITEPELQTVIAANEWFTTVQNEFVRVARAHREQYRW